MAYIANQDDDELKKQQAGGQNTSGVVGAATPGQATGGGGAAVDTSAPTSTGFVNLQSYLDANQGTGGKLAGDATKGLSDQVNTYGQTAANTVSGAKSGFDAASGDDQASNIKSGLASDANGTLGQASNFLKSGYSGPKASDYTGNLASQQGQLNGELGQVDQAPKQQDLLKSAYGTNGNQYTNGFGQLDSFLIGGSQDGRDAIAGVKAKTGDVNNAYNGAANQLSGFEQGAQAKLAANQAGIKSTAHDLFNAKDQGFQQQVAKTNSGLNRSNVGVSDYGLGNFASDKDRLDLSALSQLSGDNYDASKYKQAGGNAGTARVIDNTQGVSQTGGNGSIADVSGLSGIMKAGGTLSDATKKAGADVANSVKQPSAPNINVSSVPQNIANYVAPRIKTPKFGR